MKTIIEPFKVKVVEPIKMTTRNEREHYLQEAFYNLFLLKAENVILAGLARLQPGVPVLSVAGYEFNTPYRRFYLALAVLVVCLVLARNIDGSRLGRSLRAVGADMAAGAAGTGWSRTRRCAPCSA